MIVIITVPAKSAPHEVRIKNKAIAQVTDRHVCAIYKSYKPSVFIENAPPPLLQGKQCSKNIPHGTRASA